MPISTSQGWSTDIELWGKDLTDPPVQTFPDTAFVSAAWLPIDVASPNPSQALLVYGSQDGPVSVLTGSGSYPWNFTWSLLASGLDLAASRISPIQAAIYVSNSSTLTLELLGYATGTSDSSISVGSLYFSYQSGTEAWDMGSNDGMVLSRVEGFPTSCGFSALTCFVASTPNLFRFYSSNYYIFGGWPISTANPYVDLKLFSTPLPYTPLTTTGATNSSLLYLYFQTDETTFAEMTFNTTNGSWHSSSSVLTI
ncbi:hypothetical protein MMC13_003480 [Lambiella insularis]|nr:hypothetical protein [Lambiella insularis]